MNAAPATAACEGTPTPGDPERGRLLGLVRRLIDHGREIVAALQARNVASPPLDIARRFGGVTLALIIARITRGLMIAEALEARLLRPIPRAAEPTQRTRTETTRAETTRTETTRTRKPRQAQPDEDAELLGKLPSAREIAARIRNRRTNTVLLDICRDLGIGMQHPLWREIEAAVIRLGGTMMKLIRICWRRTEQVAHLPMRPEDEARFERLMAEFARPP